MCGVCESSSLQVVTEGERERILRSLSDTHSGTPTLFTRYMDCTLHPHTLHTHTRDLHCSIRIKKTKRRLVVDKTAYPHTPPHLYSDLWTNLYQPLTPEEVMGNTESCRCLYEWLASHKQTPRGRGRGWSSDDDEEERQNALLLCGPPGSGKTAAVYACSHQLNIKVSITPSPLHTITFSLLHTFTPPHHHPSTLSQIHEVNCSVLRDRGSLLSALREATLSHQVTSQGLFGSAVSIATFSVILLEEVHILSSCPCPSL